MTKTKTKIYSSNEHFGRAPAGSIQRTLGDLGNVDRPIQEVTSHFHVQLDSRWNCFIVSVKLHIMVDSHAFASGDWNDFVGGFVERQVLATEGAVDSTVLYIEQEKSASLLIRLKRRSSCVFTLFTNSLTCSRQ